MANNISFKDIKELLTQLQESFTEKMFKLQKIKQQLVSRYWSMVHNDGTKEPTLNELVEYFTTDCSPIVTIFKHASHVELDDIGRIKSDKLLIESTSLCDLSNFMINVHWNEEAPYVFIFDTPSGEEPTAITNLTNAFVAEKHRHFKKIIFRRPIVIDKATNMINAFRVAGLQELEGHFDVPQIERNTFYYNEITGENITFREGCLKAKSNFGWFRNLNDKGIDNIITGLCQNTGNNELRLVLHFGARFVISVEQIKAIKEKGWTLYWTDDSFKEEKDIYFK